MQLRCTNISVCVVKTGAKCMFSQHIQKKASAAGASTRLAWKSDMLSESSPSLAGYSCGFVAQRCCVCCENRREVHVFTTHTKESERRRREHASTMRIRHPLHQM